MAEAKVTIEAAERRLIGQFNTPQEQSDFEALVQANTLTGLIDDPQGFLQYWRTNRTLLLEDAVKTAAKPLNWQLFAAQSFTKYKIEKTRATENPAVFMKWMESVVNNPWVEWTSWKTWAAIVGAYLFVKGVAKGALVAGPAAGAVNAALSPIVTPINQKLSVIGNKYLGPVGMVLNSWLFDGQAKEGAAELSQAKEAVGNVRALVEGRTYQLSGKNWSGNMKSLYKVFNLLNYLFSLVPDAYKNGRDRVTDLVLMRPRDFAAAVTTSINAAEVQRQGAEGVLDRLIAKGANADAVEKTAAQLMQLAEQQVRTEREQPERSAEFQPAIDAGKAELGALGASPEQAERVVENFRKVFVFRRQAATVLAAQLLHDTMFSETIQGAEKLYSEFFNNHSLGYLHGELKAEVIEILDRLEFKIEAKLAAAQIKPAGASAAKPESKVLENVLKFNKTGEASRVINEPGSVSKPEAHTPEERAKESAVRARSR